MSSRPWGYRKGGQPQLIKMLVDSTSADIVAGDFIVPVTAGYVGQGAAGELPIGVAWSTVASPAADGGASVMVVVDTDAIFEYQPDAGTVTQGLVGTTMDVGGAQSVNIDASVDDILTVVEVDTDRNTVFVKLTKTQLGVA